MARAAQQIRGGVCAFESRAHPSPTVPTTLGERPHRALLRSLRPRERCSDLGRRDGALVAPACWTRRRPLAHFLLDRYVSRRLALWGGALLSSVWQDEPLPLPWTAFTQAARVSSVSPGVYLGQHCSLACIQEQLKRCGGGRFLGQCPADSAVRAARRQQRARRVQCRAGGLRDDMPGEQTYRALLLGTLGIALAFAFLTSGTCHSFYTP